MRRWCCRRCGSSDLSVIVQWAESVESVDQSEEELSPVGSGSGDIARLLGVACNGCDVEDHEHPFAQFERRELSPEAAADADSPGGIAGAVLDGSYDGLYG